MAMLCGQFVYILVSTTELLLYSLQPDYWIKLILEIPLQVSYSSFFVAKLGKASPLFL